MAEENTPPNPNDLTYFSSNKGKKKLMHRGYVYRKNGERNETVYWLCEKSLDSCNGRLTVKNEIVTKEQPHNHAPDMSVGKVQMAIAAMKENVTDARESTSAIINRHQERLDRNFRPYLPSDRSMRRTLQRTRRKEQPALPQSLNDVNIQGI